MSRNVLTEQLSAAQADAERISKSFKVDEKGRFEISSEQHRDYVAAVKRASEIKSVIDAMSTSEQIGAYLDAPAGAPEAGLDAGRRGDFEAKSLADVFLGSDSYQEFKSAGSNVRQRISLQGSLEGKSIFTLAGGEATVPTLGTPQTLGIAERAYRKMHIRDLFPKSSTSANVLYGTREIGWVNNAAQVRERYAADGVTPVTDPQDATNVFGKAPVSDLKLVPVQYPVAEIAHTLDAHKNILADEPRLKTFINTRMVEGVKYKEDFDLLHSDGDGESITGLFNTPGVQTYAGLAQDKYDVQIRRAITQALLAEYDPTGIVLSPQMWEEVEVTTDSTGAFRVAVAVAIGAEKRIWRLNVVETTAMADANYMIGSFGLGAALHDREAVSVSVSTETNDNFNRGVVTFRADERVALEVPRPESFVIGSWTTPTA